MCRYGETHYKEHYACFQCRKAFRYSRPTICPQCRKPLTAMGRDFHAPKHTAKEQWKVVELLAQRRITFHSCGCEGPGYRPIRLRDLPAFFAAYQPSR